MSTPTGSSPKHGSRLWPLLRSRSSRDHENCTTSPDESYPMPLRSLHSSPGHLPSPSRITAPEESTAQAAGGDGGKSGRRRKLNLRAKFKRRGRGAGGGGVRAGEAGGRPPRGYLWLYLGRFHRWKRRFFVADSPGALLFFKDASMTGERWTINLRNASVILTGKVRRQFVIVSGSFLYHCRVLEPSLRTEWVDCIQDSITSFATRRTPGIVGEAAVQDEEESGEVKVDTRADRAGSGIEVGSSKPVVEDNTPTSGQRAGLDSVHIMAKLHADHVLRRQLHPLASRVEAAVTAQRADIFATVAGFNLSPASAATPPVPPPSRDGDADGRPSLPVAWEALQDGIAAAVEALTLRIAELETENEALIHSLQTLQRRQLRLSTVGGAAPRTAGGSEAEGEETSEDEDEDEEGEGGTDEEGSGRLGSLHGGTASRGYFHAVGDEGATVGPSAEDEEEEEDDEDYEDEDDHDFGELIMLNPFEPLPNISEDPFEGGQHAALQAARPPPLGFSLWRKLNKSIGRDVRPVLLPATVNEPLSGLQRLAEEMEYAELLRGARAAADPLERLARVAAFAVSPYNSSLRTRKPFNPLLGETFEFCGGEEEGGEHLRFLAEQVSLNPPTAAWRAEGAGWKMWGELEMRSKFWGQRIEVGFSGSIHLEFPDTGDHYVWNKAGCWVHNIVLGNPWAEWHGKVAVVNLRTGDTARVRLPKCNKMPGRRGFVTGAVVAGGSGRLAYSLQGNYLDRIWALPAGSTEGGGDKLLLYERRPGLRNAAEQYNFTAFTLQLTGHQDESLTGESRGGLPPTDSRFRPDKRAVEEGDWERATAAKLALVRRQRRQRRDIRPAWFHAPRRRQTGDIGGAEDAGGWQFNGEYWTAKEAADWSRCPDIFGDVGEKT